MALEKSIVTPYGVIANYHKINKTDIDWVNKTAIIHYASYVSQEVRINGSEPIPEIMPGCRAIWVPSDKFPFQYEDTKIVETAYVYLKTTDEFSNATDC